MIAWLNENIGTDAATYIGLILGFMGLFGGAKFFNLTSNRKVNKFDGGKINEQTLNVGSGNGFQAGGDMNINIGTINSAAQEKVDEKKLHDLRIIEEIVELLPYESTVHYVDLSYISGMPYSFATSLDKVATLNGPKHKIYNHKVDVAKNDFLNAIHAFNEISMSFLTVDHPERKPLMVVPPFDWRNSPAEPRYRELQSSLSDKAAVLIEKYNEFIEAYKSEGFISDKI